MKSITKTIEDYAFAFTNLKSKRAAVEAIYPVHEYPVFSLHGRTVNGKRVISEDDITTFYLQFVNGKYRIVTHKEIIEMLADEPVSICLSFRIYSLDRELSRSEIQKRIFADFEYRDGGKLDPIK